MASTASPNKPEITPAAIRIQMMRLLNWPRRIRSVLIRLTSSQLVRAVSRQAFCRFLRRQSGR